MLVKNLLIKLTNISVITTQILVQNINRQHTNISDIMYLQGKHNKPYSKATN